ncbi:FHA domain-containing protein [Streptomyces griseochromogenes]|uniref:FHA domain-containing protein n=1 Tax=Streptomyces griseochromogenes TaxID=68214 RepID=UPI0037958E0E
MEYGNPPLFLAIEGSFLKLDPVRTYTMGRDPQSDVVFQETAISRNHAQIYWGGTSWVLEDLNSTNGTYGLGQRISLAEAGHGSVFRLGDEAEGPQLRFTGQPGPQDGAKAASLTRIGRSSDNDLVVRGTEVASYHGKF